MSFWDKILQLLGLYHKPSSTITTTTINTTTILGNKKMKKALVFSINDYPGTQNDLQGCNNDSQNWADLLKNQYGFEIYNRIIDSSATRSNVKKDMLDLIVNSQDGDVLVITYSGHGTSVVDLDNDEEDGKDECICLYDGLMKDDEIRDVLNKLPSGVKLTFISDSCFSGTVTRSFMICMNDFTYVSTPKYLPPKDNIDAIHVMGLPSKRSFAIPEEGMNHILISGTDDRSYSYDANIDGKACGAFSYYAIKVLKENPVITYNAFYEKLRKYLPNNQYPQNPQLEGSEENKNSIMFE